MGKIFCVKLQRVPCYRVKTDFGPNECDQTDIFIDNYHQNQIVLHMNVYLIYREHICGLMQERCNSIANALELLLSCSKPLIYTI